MASLSIATWNCFGMGQGVVDAITANRAPFGERLQHEEVHSTLAVPDVVCIQEVLSKDAETFFDTLGVVRVRDHNKSHFSSATLRGSGLGIAARVPIATFNIEAFGGKSSGWDRLARKGTLYARLKVHGVEVDVLTGHLQSGYDVTSCRVRSRQIEELARRVAQLGSEGRPFVVAGDFNVCGLAGGSEEYEALRRALPGFEDLGAAEDLPTFDPHPERNSLAHGVEPDSKPQRIDYLFVRGARACNVSRIFDRPFGEKTFASDHFGLAATLDIE
ncbi:MAG: endonuclease/exonuclease/phosphatase family protein [Polyangiales bacterium]